eukprot:gene7333-8539_t
MEQEDGFCKIHKKKRLKATCKQCNVLVCGRCVFSEHEGHSFSSSLDETENKIRDIGPTRLKALWKHVNFYADLSESNRCNGVRVDSFFDDLTSYLNSERHRIKNTLEQESTKIVERISTTLTQIENIIHVQQSNQTISSSAQFIELQRSYPSLNDRLLNDISSLSTPPKKDSLPHLLNLLESIRKPIDDTPSIVPCTIAFDPEIVATLKDYIKEIYDLDLEVMNQNITGSSLDTTTINDQSLQTQQEPAESSLSIYVGGIPETTTEEAINEIFRKWGEVKNIIQEKDRAKIEYHSSYQSNIKHYQQQPLLLRQSPSCQHCHFQSTNFQMINNTANKILVNNDNDHQHDKKYRITISIPILSSPALAFERPRVDYNDIADSSLRNSSSSITSTTSSLSSSRNSITTPETEVVEVMFIGGYNVTGNMFYNLLANRWNKIGPCHETRSSPYNAINTGDYIYVFGANLNSISTFDIQRGLHTHFMDLNLDGANHVISSSCYDGKSYLYVLTSRGHFSNINLDTQCSYKLPIAPVSYVPPNTAQLFYFTVKGAPRIYFFGLTFCAYYSVNDRRWVQIAKPPSQVVKSGIVGL